MTPVAMNATATVTRPSPLDAECERLHRVLQVLQLIQGQGGWDASALARECGKNVRTMYRDIRLLQDAGVPVSFDEENRCYSIRGDYFMQPVDLTFEEALSLVALAEHVAKEAQIPFTQAAVRAMAKVRGQLPEKIRRELKAIDGHLSIRLSEPGPRDGISDVFAKMQQAIANGVVLKCRYESVSGRSVGKSFMFKPYKLHFDRRAWYVVGLHCGHDEVRWLKLNRFSEVRLTEHTYKVPSDFEIGEHLGNAWRMVRGDRSYAVEVLFDAEFSENIADTAWHKTQETEELADGRLRFRCRVDGLDEIQWWVLARGPHCKVVRPRELADRVKELAQRTAAQYGR